ncbi:MAG: GNAT family N-acetyltransferase [Desulfobacter sp.]|nr:GNAT family N-acetyltransferase [Desulfobacter sp.]
MRRKSVFLCCVNFTPERSLCPGNIFCNRTATIKGHLVGYICIDLKAKIDDTKAYEIVTLYVQEHFQKKGVGTKLIEHITKEHGPKQWLTTWTYNDNAIQFYRHLGFVPVGETYFEFDNERHKNLIFKKN